MATVVEMTRTEARRRRREILRELGVAEDVLRAKADDYSLSAEELAGLSEIDRLDYLLAEQ